MVSLTRFVSGVAVAAIVVFLIATKADVIGYDHAYAWAVTIKTIVFVASLLTLIVYIKLVRINPEDTFPYYLGVIFSAIIIIILNPIYPIIQSVKAMYWLLIAAGVFFAKVASGRDIFEE